MIHPALLGSGVSRLVTDSPVLCPGCDRKLAWFATRPWRIRCRHCKTDVDSPTDTDTDTDAAAPPSFPRGAPHPDGSYGLA